MTEAVPPTPHQSYPAARLRRQRFSPIWLIPIVAALIAGYLGWRDYSTHGPLITLTFRSAKGLIAGQTQIRYKDVTVGTVENIHLSQDLSNVVVEARMASSAKPFLTDTARFWVVRLQLTSFNPSDIETLVSGSYIQVDPGKGGGDAQDSFTGLETPPTDHPDEPGSIFVLKADKLGALTMGSPLYYRDIDVGEVLSYDMGNGFDPLTVTIMVHSPYDKLVRDKSRFWNASGLSLNLGPKGFHIETHSLRTVLTGGISFDTPPEAENDAAATPKSIFTLYDDEQDADNAVYAHRVRYVSFFQTSVKDLDPGTPVTIYGLPVGEVTGVKLMFDPQKNAPQVRVEYEIAPERAFGVIGKGQEADATQILHNLVEKGIRVKIESSNILTGQKVLALEFAPNAEPTAIAQDGDLTVLPSAGSSDNFIGALNDIAGKLDQIHFEDIGAHLDHLVGSADKVLGGPDMQQTIHNLSIAMANAADLTRKANANMTPALQRLPEISAQLQSAVDHANQLFGGLQNSYGDGSDFQRDAKRTLDQANDAARSIRLLADFLERHPEALLTGKQNEKDKP